MIATILVSVFFLGWTGAYRLGRWRGELDSADVVAHLRSQVRLLRMSQLKRMRQRALWVAIRESEKQNRESTRRSSDRFFAIENRLVKFRIACQSKIKQLRREP